ncbi:DUF7230 family protein [Acinetobacter sp. MD2]|uniref:DUF7230 family protein n=1 Tax=Acinetobacter sp. MD2 TaxID=2600066 RepID=UPI002D76DD44|nr:hypothetical protein [Acinetobacter sp. MD2]
MKNHKQSPQTQIMRNLVAKNMYEFQRSHVFVDRKKDSKRGKTKHKKERYSCEDRSFFIPIGWA